MARDYYEVLGVSRGSSPDEIRKAHRKLVRTLHPDVNKGADAASKFAEVQEAYDILSDEQKRARYDQFGHAGVRSGADPGAGTGGAGGAHQAWQQVDPETFQSIFENFGDLFGSGARGGTGRRSGKRGSSEHGFDFSSRGAPWSGEGTRAGPGADAEAETTIAFETAAAGGTAAITLQSPEGGSERIDVKIPAGIADGARMRVRGKGHPSPNGGTRGDLVLTVRVAPHPWFRREGLDILLDVPITIVEAALGASIEVPLLKGSATLKVPSGVSGGRRLRLRGKGITDSHGRSGDFLAVLAITAPKELDDEAREALERVAASLPDPRAGLWGAS